MRPEDIGGLWEEALGKIEPRDDAHRERLQRFQEKLRESSEEMVREIEAIKTQAQSTGRSGLVDMKIVEDRTRIAKETVRQISNAFDFQAVLVERIAKKFSSG